MSPPPAFESSYFPAFFHRIDPLSMSFMGLASLTFVTSIWRLSFSKAWPFWRRSQEEPAGNGMFNEASAGLKSREAGKLELPPGPMKISPSRYSTKCAKATRPGDERPTSWLGMIRPNFFGKGNPTEGLCFCCTNSELEVAP